VLIRERVDCLPDGTLQLAHAAAAASRQPRRAGDRLLVMIAGMG